MDHPTGKTRTPAGGRGRGRRPLPACPGPRGLCVLRRRRASAGRTEREPDSAPGPRPRSSGAHEEAQVLRPRRAVPHPPPKRPPILPFWDSRLPGYRRAPFHQGLAGCGAKSPTQALLPSRGVTPLRFRCGGPDPGPALTSHSSHSGRRAGSAPHQASPRSQRRSRPRPK